MKKTILLLSIICFYASNSFAQSFCGTSPAYQNTLAGVATTKTVNGVMSNLVVDNCVGITVNLRFHIIRNTDGSGGYPLSVVSTITNSLASVYNKWGIYFSINGATDIINNDQYSLNSNWEPDGCVNLTNFNNLIQVNSDNAAVNIYILDNSTWNQGLANGIPGTSIVIGGKILGSELVTSLAMAHEVGHCLNLFHPAHGCETNCGIAIPGVCLELPNGTNGTTCGDFVADTPADPRVNFNVTNCVWNQTAYAACIAPNLTVNNYNPDVTNIMNYTPVNCMVGFTEGQAS